MNYITIDVQTQRSITIINYGPWKTELALKKSQKKRLDEFGILLQFRRTSLAVGETATLTVIWQPMSTKYTEKKAEEEHFIYLEVTLTIFGRI